MQLSNLGLPLGRPGVPAAGGGGGALGNFRATNSATQAIVSTTDTLILADEVFDSEDAFASNEYVVPAGLDGLYGVFNAGVQLNINNASTIQIERDTGGGYAAIAEQRNSIDTYRDLACSSGVVLLTTGDTYRVRVRTGTGQTVQNEANVFFSLGVVS